MKALILNSGIGKRMGSLTKDHPKCLCRIGDKDTILGWQLAILRQNGVEDIVITTGPFAQTLQDYVLPISPNATFVHNPLYDKTNYIYSMFLARDLLDDDVILLHGDLVLETSVITNLLDAPNSVVAIDASAPLPQKDFKARLSGGFVREIGVGVFGADCVALQPAYKLLRNDMAAWLLEIERFCSRGETNVYAENALNTILEKTALYPMELGDKLCREIDDADDLAAVSLLFCSMQAEKGECK